MALKDAYKLDQSLAFDKGYQVDFYDELGNVVGFVMVKYAGPSNKKFTAFRTAFMKPYERKVQAGSMPEAESDKLLQEAFVRGGIITGWSEGELNVDSFKAAMQECPPETWRDIFTTAYNAKFFTPITREDEIKNSN
jgi:hypothetical protein